MSTLLRLVRSQINTSRLVFSAPKNVKISDVVRRTVSSTPKKDENVSAEPYKVKKTWASYGFDFENKYLDRHFMHLSLFVCVSCLLVFGSFIVAYLPDPNMKDWARREGYLQLRYREENGLPLIDKNVVDPSKFVLPTDEELGLYEIII